MKNFKLLFGVIVLTMISFQSYSQEYELEEKTVSGIFNVEGTNKSEIFSSINKWISINYNSTKNVVQLNDKESGNIIIKGINEVKSKNTWKSLYPNKKYITEHVITKLNHLIEINIKDKKYRVIYKIIGTPVGDTGFNDLIFNCISFNGINEKYIDEYNEVMDTNLKKGLIGEKKREDFLSLTKPMFEEFNSNLLNDIKLTMKSIEQSVKSQKKEEW